MRQNIAYKYEVFVEHVESLASQISTSGRRYSFIVGLGRGGLVPAVCLSHKLKTPMISIDWSRGDREENFSYAIPQLIQQDINVLIVDDILDTGEALTSLLQVWQSFESGSLKTCNIDIAVLLQNTDIKAPQVGNVFAAYKFSRAKMPNFIDFFWEQL